MELPTIVLAGTVAMITLALTAIITFYVLYQKLQQKGAHYPIKLREYNIKNWK